MSGLTGRITEVLREHELGYNAPGGFHCVSVTCDWYGHDLDFYEHVAERIEAELQLTEEWFIPTFRDEKGNARGFQNFGTLEAAKKWADFWDPQPEIYSRWVSAWSEVKG